MHIDSVRQAVSSPLLETTIEGATGIILNIKGGLDLTLEEVYNSAELVKEVVDPTCNIIFGSGIDETMQDEVEITVIATGFTGSTVADDMKKEVIRSVSNSLHASEFVDKQVEQSNLFEQAEPEPEPKQNAPQITDNDSPPFLRKIKSHKF